MTPRIPLTAGRGDRVNPRLGLPSWISKFRDGQLEKIESLIDTLTQRKNQQVFQANQDPVGAGKTVNHVVTAVASNLRTCIVTNSKALQDQIEDDFGGEDGIVADIRGIANYPCSHRGADNCEEGRHLDCANARTSRCPREVAYRNAQQSRIVSTNYALWMLDLRLPRNGKVETLGTFDFVVFDEAHSAFDQICGAIGGELTPSDFEILKGLNVAEHPRDDNRERAKSWARWARGGLAKVSSDIESLRLSEPTKRIVQRILKLIRIKQTLKRISRGTNRHWVVDLPADNHVITQPVWPRGFLGELVGSVPNILLTSATMPPKVLDLLGIPEDVIYRDYPSIFDPARSPNLILPCGSMKYRSEAATFPTLVRRLSNILRASGSVRTIIHTASYDRAFRLRAMLNQYQDRIILNSRGRFWEAMSRYRSQSDGIFISPSLTTGVDLKGDLCRLNIMIKAPFANTTSNIERLRYKLDPDYYYFKAVMAVRQALGRGMREPQDWCRNLMLDTDIGWLIRANRHHLSDDFQVKYVQSVPEVFTKIKGEC